MHHTSASRGHWLVAIGAIVIIGSTLLQWWQIGGGPGQLSAQTGMGISDGRVFLMFLASVATLLLVTLPFASEGPVAIDHPLSYLALLVIALLGYVLRLVSLAQQQLLPWPPQLGVGLWLAAVGLAVFARGVFEVYEERRRRLY
jgi:magnesium-transporting ATPase (P-type)